MADMQFIIAFLEQVEGKRQTVGYIPCYKKTGGTANYKGGHNPENYQAMGASGVTIATGVDLGQKDRQELELYGLSENIITIFAPYLGKKRDAAIRILYTRPLVISEEHAKATDLAVHKGYLNHHVRPMYEKYSGVAFDSLPKEAQAVIMSLCYQLGPTGARTGAPKTWKWLCQRNWQAASRELITGFPQYKNRRRQEGELLAMIGTAGGTAA